MIELRTLGTLVLRDANGEDIGSVLAQPKRVALLSYLAIARPRGFHRRDSLLALLWPEQDEQHARWALNQALRHLRTALGKEAVLSRGGGEVGIDRGAVTCDAVMFEAALKDDDPARALGLYRGDLLEGFHVTGCSDFEHWLEEERVWLRRSAARAASTLAQSAERQGEPVAAGHWARRAFALTPDDEGEARQLIELLGRIGDRAGAVQAYEEFAKRLREGYEVDPAPETQASIAAVRTRQAPPPGGGVEDANEHGAGNGVRPLIQQPSIPGVGNGEGANYGAQTVPGSPSRRVQRAQILSLTGVGAVVLLLAGVGYSLWKGQGTIGTAESVAVPRRKMLAVLPFENRGPAADDYFADGLTEAIGMRLGGVRSLGVIASQSARQYKGTKKSLAQIGRELGVQYVLQGSVWWEKAAGSSRVRVSPTLLRVSDGRQLWAAEYDTVLAGMFALQTGLASQVVGALDIALGSTDRRMLEAPTASPEAYDAFLRGTEAAQASSPAERRTSVDYFERAVALDSTFAMAYAYLSISHVIMYLSYLDRDVERLKRAKAAVDRVMQLDPECDSGSCCGVGFYQLFVLKDYDGALRAFNRARLVRPSDHNLPGVISHVYRRQGQWSKALAYQREAERLNPLDAGEAGALGRTYALLRQFAAANYYLDRALAGTPNVNNARLVKALAYLNLTGDLKGARRFLPDVSENISPTGTEDVIVSLHDIVLLLGDEQQTRLLHLTPAALDGDTAALALAKALVHQRRNQRTFARASFDSARVVLQEKVRRNPNDDPFYHAMLGLALAGLGRSEDAVREGERAVELLPYPAGGPESTLMPANLARIHVLLGHREKATDLLSAVFSRPGPLSPAWLRVDPFWNPLRSTPSFQRLTAARNADYSLTY